MDKTVTCPDCGRILCRASEGSKVNLKCHFCKIEVIGVADKDGVRVIKIAKPISSKPKVKKQ